MMDYNVFKSVVAARIKEFLPPLYASFDQHIQTVPKINGIKEALIMDMDMGEKRLAAPNIYLDDLYEEFKKTGDLDKALEEAAMMIVSFTGAQELGDDSAYVTDYKKDIVKALVNTARNEELLETAPHRSFLDLSVIYRFAVEEGNEGGYATALVTTDVMEDMGLTDDELDALAEENTQRKLKTKIMALSDDVMVLTTKQVLYGAVNLLRNNVLRNLAEHMDDDLYLIAGSMHEIVAVKSTCSQRDEIIDSLRNDSFELSGDGEFLSDSVYFYSRNTNSVSIFTE